MMMALDPRDVNPGDPDTFLPMGMTIVEKIFARASGQPRVAPGDLVVVDVDCAVMIDMSFHKNQRREVLKVFDPERIRSTATYESPRSFPEGIDWVVVAGEIVVAPDGHTGARPGRTLRRWR